MEVELVLMKVDEPNNDGIETICNTAVAQLLDDLLSRFSCREASDWLQHGNDSVQSIQDSIRDDVERFVRPSDRLLTLAAILIKSRAFLRVHSVTAGVNQTTKVQPPLLVRLPRTIHNKPYIPQNQNHSNGEASDDDDATLSISHQFPFVGAAQLQVNGKEKGENPKIKIGLDIVVEEPLNTRLYDTWDDFVHVFRASFGSEEWDTIVTTGESAEARMHEFLLRWATKEAYTKALGVGLGFDFASFWVQFENLPASCQGRLDEYLRLSLHQRHNESSVITPVCIHGTVVSDRQMKSEIWDFYFGSLRRNHDVDDPWSWYCVAVGPMENEPDTDVLRVQWTSLKEFITASETIQDSSL